MKTNFIKLVLAACFISLTFIMCNKDDDDTPDPNAFCDDGICANDQAKKQECIDAFNTCIENNPDANDDECVATAILICGIK